MGKISFCNTVRNILNVGFRMETIQAQLALFYSPDTHPDFDGASYFLRTELKKQFGESLDKSGVLELIPKEVPGKVPRVELKNNDGTIKIRISLVRLDLYYEKKISGPSLDVTSFLKVAEVVLDIQKKLNNHIRRVGLIATQADAHASPKEYIYENCLNPEKLPAPDKLKNINVSYNQPISKSDMQFNHMKTFSEGKNTRTGEEVVLIKHDVNSLQESNFEKDYTFEIMAEVFNECLK